MGALIITIAVALITGTLAGLSNHFGFDKTWYGDILTTADCIFCFFALLNLGYVLMEGITVENGEVFLGIDADKQPIRFHVSRLASVELCEAEEGRGAVLRFFLTDGSTKEYRGARVTPRVLARVRAYFEI